MPLRDHFRPPVSENSNWEGFHGQWPAIIVHRLRKSLPTGYVAEPRVHLGAMAEIDIAAFEKDEIQASTADDGGGGTAVAVWAPAAPSIAVAARLPEQYEYAVHIYDTAKSRRLVAAIEIVSPANKDRPDNRSAFVSKCSALIQQGVAVSIVDVVTTKHFNLYLDLLETDGHTDPTLGDPPPYLYATSCRGLKRVRKKPLLQAWSHRLEVGQPLPTLPLWLDVDRVVPLDLEASYEQACYDLSIT